MKLQQPVGKCVRAQTSPTHTSFPSPPLHTRRKAYATPRRLTSAQITAAVVNPAISAEVASSYVSQEARRAVFGSAQEQIAEADAHVVSGSLPGWLRGSLLFNGCGEYRGMRHLFDGYACMTRIRLDGGTGRVAASQRFLDSDAYRSFSRTGRMKYREFDTLSYADGPVGRAVAVLEYIAALMAQRGAFTDNASVNVIPLPGRRLMALSETRPAVFLVDPDTLDTVRQVEYGDDLPGDMASAHPKPAPDGSIINFTRSLPLGGIHVYRQDAESLERKQIAFVRDRDPFSPCWVHDIALSSSHVVLVEPPLFMNMASMVLGTQRQFCFMDWKPEAGTLVHVIALDGSGVVTHTAPPFFTLHVANAFERPAASGSGTEICVDFSMYDDPKIMEDLSLARLNAFPGAEVSPSRVRRLTIPLRDAAGRPVGPSSLAAPAPLIKDDGTYGNSFEFPAFNPRFRGKPYRYVYGTAAVRPTNMNNALARHDLQEGVSALWHEPGALPAEPSFVPRPGGSAESDGVLIAPVAMPDGSGAVVVLDGKSMREMARVALPFPVPYRFHGTFVAEP